MLIWKSSGSVRRILQGVQRPTMPSFTKNATTCINAYLAAVPGNAALNLRRLWITNANYENDPFLFTLHHGDPVNEHLNGEYLALLETSHHTPDFLNLHHRDIAHTVINNT